MPSILFFVQIWLTHILLLGDLIFLIHTIN